MLKLIILVSLSATIGFAAPAGIAVIRHFQDIEPDGSYQYAYETENGIFAQEEGKVQKINEDNVDILVQGSFLYTSPEGEEISLKYTADKDGFHPEGNHLPIAPPIPPLILRALEWNAAHPDEN